MAPYRPPMASCVPEGTPRHWPGVLILPASWDSPPSMTNTGSTSPGTAPTTRSSPTGSARSICDRVSTPRRSRRPASSPLLGTWRRPVAREPEAVRSIRSRMGQEPTRIARRRGSRRPDPLDGPGRSAVRHNELPDQRGIGTRPGEKPDTAVRRVRERRWDAGGAICPMGSRPTSFAPSSPGMELSRSTGPA